MNIRDLQEGDSVYVIYRNPHTQNVATIQEATITSNPENPNELSLFMYDTYYPLSDEYAMYQTPDEAEQMYEYYFGPTM
ncbi:transcriptional regulator SplA domain-containing protein [Alkalihalobacterium alkalinitrilicum]|uniref:transcriptional regulator SplA domain-containing protein n=1 Tax=Alkalihalobacterium alkalinitrilicum TaxID=427920 RepID=UPI000995BA90|nr:transcriptional regulator SplA domain-containing protein [Alkalihalobacterium alkalinitrilicum]